MTAAPSPANDDFVSDAERDEMLNDIATKWRRFSRQELAALQTNDELVTEVVAKYGMEELAAQREVEALMDGRSLAGTSNEALD